MPKGEAETPKNATAEGEAPSAQVADPAAPAPKPPWQDPVLLGALVLWIGTLLLLRSFDHSHTLPTLSVVASDVVARPGDSVELTARVSRRLASGAIEKAGIDVELRLVSEEPGSGRVKTDAAGIARRSLPAPNEPGSAKFAVFIDGEFHADPGIFLDPALYVLDRSKPWFLCEVEAVAPVAAETNEGAPDSEGVSLEAVSALRQLTEGRQVIFVSTGEARHSDRWRGAFRLRAVPPAPILADRRPEEGADDYRRRTLAELTARFGPPGAVITHSATGCFIYREAEIPTIVWKGPPCDGARRAESWKAVESTVREWLPIP